MDAADLHLVESLRDGSERAYEELLSVSSSRFTLWRYACSTIRARPATWFRKYFLKVFRNVGNFRGQSTLKTWIYRITVNEAHNARRWFFRHRRAEVELDKNPEESRNWKEIIPDGSRSPFDAAFDSEQHVMIEAA